jgi:hypothetical protein
MRSRRESAVLRARIIADDRSTGRVAADLGVSTSFVRRVRREAQEAALAEPGPPLPPAEVAPNATRAAPEAVSAPEDAAASTPSKDGLPEPPPPAPEPLGGALEGPAEVAEHWDSSSPIGPSGIPPAPDALELFACDAEGCEGPVSVRRRA